MGFSRWNYSGSQKAHVTDSGGNIKLNSGSLEHAFLRLLVSRFNVYAVQLSKGGYLKVEEPLTIEVIKRHLCSSTTVGVYQLDEASMVKWLCFDLDPEKLDNPLSTAKAIIHECISRPDPKAPRFYKRALLFEASRHPDPSYHIWIFFQPLPVPAKAARWLGLRILEHANINPKLIEVFPKQTELTKDRPFGNLVKLPLGLHRVAEKWSFFLDFETLKPLPNNCILDVRGVSFPETDLVAICEFEEKKHVQVRLQLPKNPKLLESKEKEKIAAFLGRYWRRGSRNRLEMAFLGWAIKRGISHQSAKQIVAKVVQLANDEEASLRLRLVDYHYRNRRSMATQLVGSSGVR